MRALLLPLLVLLAACEGAGPGAFDPAPYQDTATVDVDGDGAPVGEDCADEDPTRYPGAPEMCDGVDQDCDGEVDEQVEFTFWRDADGDGHGTAGATIRSCTLPAGYAPRDGDCDDGDPAVHPGADEACDGVDQDCDGEADDGATTTMYADADRDGFGDAQAPGERCAVEPGWVLDASDCDDRDEDEFPGAPETCDGDDDDCDGVIDEDDAVDAPAWYADADGDGFGDADATAVACEAPAGFLADATDCDDADPATSPAGTETCDGVDQDCDGTVDEDAVDARPWYADADGDGFGDAAAPTWACEAPAGTVADADDCDDADPDEHPGATERCDGADDDCDGTTDEDAVDAPAWYADADGDGHGDAAAPTWACAAPAGTVADADDCDDGDAATSPSAPEVCGGADEDCDGTTDEPDASDAADWYADADGDGYGDADVATTACDAPAGFGADASDCDDADADTFPGATETCDGVDDDCDGTVDDGGVDPGTWYADADGDGYGDAAVATVACSAPAGTVADASDCDDGDAATSPAGVETCDGRDQDCDGVADDDATDATDWYADADGDGFGAGAATRACAAPAGTVADADDCDDADPAVADGTTWYLDADGDGFGDASAAVVSCEAPSGYLADDTDCDDGDLETNPDAAEVCADGVDQDCNGLVDDDCTVHCGAITVNETWGAGVHEVTCDVTVAGAGAPVLTVEDGAVVRFSSGAKLTIGDTAPGTLVVAGGASGVTFTSAQATPAAGDWVGIVVSTYGTGSSVEGATVEYAGQGGDGSVVVAAPTATLADVEVRDGDGDGLLVAAGAEADVTDCTFADNAGSGVSVEADATLGTFTGNTTTGNGAWPIELPPEAVDALDASSTFTGNAEDRIALLRGDIEGTVTWRALDADYLVTSRVRVRGGTSAAPAVLTIEDGVTVLFDTDTYLQVGDVQYAQLVADGTGDGILFTSAQASPAPGDWYGIEIEGGNSTHELTGVTIDYGGGNGEGNLSLGTATTVLDGVVSRFSSTAGLYATTSSNATVVDSTFEDNDGYGIYLPNGADLVPDAATGEAFSRNVVTGNGTRGIALPPDMVAWLDATSTLTGNADDRVQVRGGTVTNDATWHDLGLVYQVSSDVWVHGFYTPTLTLEDGVELEFDSGAGLAVAATAPGRLLAEGTVDGIVFTSSQAAPGPGDWDGLYFGRLDTGSWLQGVEFAYAGGNGFGTLYYQGAVNALGADDVYVHDSSSWGIYRSGCAPSITNATYAGNASGDLF